MVRVISDIHGNFDKYQKLIKGCDKSIQLGDYGVGFGAENWKVWNEHKFICGNHDNRTLATETMGERYLGAYGEWEGIFYVGGAYSIDKPYRTPGVSWWADEELNWFEQEQCLDAWGKSQCKIVVSHDGPQSVVRDMFGINDKSNTRQLLQEMLRVRIPKKWIFGHHHQFKKSGPFICLEEFGYIDV